MAVSNPGRARPTYVPVSLPRVGVLRGKMRADPARVYAVGEIDPVFAVDTA
jgi:hypothetical protein